MVDKETGEPIPKVSLSRPWTEEIKSAVARGGVTAVLLGYLIWWATTEIPILVRESLAVEAKRAESMRQLSESVRKQSEQMGEACHQMGGVCDRIGDMCETLKKIHTANP